MKPAYRVAAVTGGLGAVALGWALFAPSSAPGLALLIVATAGPAAILALVCGRLELSVPIRPLLLGASLAPVIALLTHPLVAGFAVFFLGGFANPGSQLAGALQADPELTTLLASPWLVLLLIDIAAVAPLTEEFGKALAAVLARPKSRAEAFLFGVAAGAGFAMVEDILYAGAAAYGGGPWPLVGAARGMGAAVHPLATGIVALAWWEWRHGAGLRALVRGYLAAVSLHAFFNGSSEVVFVVAQALGLGTITVELDVLVLTYELALGAAAALLLWRLTETVARGHALTLPSLGGLRPMAAWTLLSASLLIPVGILVQLFPVFHGG